MTGLRRDALGVLAWRPTRIPFVYRWEYVPIWTTEGEHGYVLSTKTTVLPKMNALARARFGSRV